MVGRLPETGTFPRYQVDLGFKEHRRIELELMTDSLEPLTIHGSVAHSTVRCPLWNPATEVVG